MSATGAVQAQQGCQLPADEQTPAGRIKPSSLRIPSVGEFIYGYFSNSSKKLQSPTALSYPSDLQPPEEQLLERCAAKRDNLRNFSISFKTLPRVMATMEGEVVRKSRQITQDNCAGASVSGSVPTRR